MEVAVLGMPMTMTTAMVRRRCRGLRNALETERVQWMGIGKERGRGRQRRKRRGRGTEKEMERYCETNHRR